MKTADYVFIIPRFHNNFLLFIWRPSSRTVTVSVKTPFSFQAATDKTSENVHQTILETNQLTQCWENVVKQMKQQDIDSQTCATVKKYGAHSSGTHTHTQQIYKNQPLHSPRNWHNTSRPSEKGTSPSLRLNTCWILWRRTTGKPSWS